MSLQFIEEIVCKSVGSIPTVPDRYFLVLSIIQFLPSKAIVLKVVDRFQKEYAKCTCQQKEHSSLSIVFHLDKSYEQNIGNHSQNSIIHVERFVLLFLVIVHTYELPNS